MNAFVHFAVGLSLGLLILGVIEIATRTEFLLTFTSGVWALIPDGHWMLHAFGATDAAAVWKQFHRSPMANLFWFHRFIDRHETGQPKVEMEIALGLVSVLFYYFVNSWHDISR